MNRRIFTRIGQLLAIILVAILVLQAAPLATASAQGTQPVACVTAYRLNVRSGPGITYSVISGLSLNQCVTMAGYRNADATWVQFTTANGLPRPWYTCFTLRCSGPKSWSDFSSISSNSLGTGTSST